MTHLAEQQGPWQSLQGQTCVRRLASVLLMVSVLWSVTVSIISGASALEVPPLTGRIVDLAAVLPQQTIANLAVSLQAHEARTGNQVAVLILSSLEGAPLEPYAHQVITTWQLGQLETDNGALLLVAVKDRKVRIEVGYGLEGTLTDIRSAQIIRNEILPRFRVGDFPGGIAAGVQAMLQTIEGTYRAADHPRQPIESGEWSATFKSVVVGIVVGTLAGLILSQGRKQMRAFFGSLLAFMIAQSASLPAGLGAALVTSLLITLSLSGAGTGGRRRLRRDSDFVWFPGGIDNGGWSRGSGGGLGGGFGGGDSFAGGGGDAGGGGASGSW